MLVETSLMDGNVSLSVSPPLLVHHCGHGNERFYGHSLSLEDESHYFYCYHYFS